MLIGDWRGDSVCVVRASACADEKSLYHIKKQESPDHFSLQADKIVDGKPITMGTIDCTYQQGKHALTCELPKGVLHFTLQASKLDGTMSMTDGTLWRNISLKKDGS